MTKKRPPSGVMQTDWVAPEQGSPLTDLLRAWDTVRAQAYAPNVHTRLLTAENLGLFPDGSTLGHQLAHDYLVDVYAQKCELLVRNPYGVADSTDAARIVETLRRVKGRAVHGNRVLTTVADLCGYFNAESPREAARRLYKDTACGPWMALHTKETGAVKLEDARLHETLTSVLVGSIVEGSEAEVLADELKAPIRARELDAAIEYLDGEVDRLWKEANEETDDA